MLSIRRVGALALFAVIVGCSERVTAPSRAIAAESADRFAGSDNDVTKAVTGSAYFHIPSEENAFESYEVSAIQHRDGSVSGQAEIRGGMGGGFEVHGETTCLGVTGNNARLAIRVTRSTNPNVVPGNYIVWSLADNGEGRKSAPDLTSEVYRVTQPDAEYHCAVGMNILATLAVERGNLQVH
jgi:hypothetical protein